MTDADVMANKLRAEENVESEAAKDEEAEREEEEDEGVLARVLQCPFRDDTVDGDD